MKIRMVVMTFIMLFVITLYSTQAVNAAPINDSSNNLIGYTDILVDGSYYDVSFIDGTFESIFPNGSDDLVFSDFWDALDASQALSDQVFTLQYDLDPELTRGVASEERGKIITPYRLSTDMDGNWNGDVLFSAFYNDVLEPLDSVPIESIQDRVIYYLTDTTSDASTTWAVWSEVVTPVPEPSTVLLLGSGIVWYGRKRKKR